MYVCLFVSLASIAISMFGVLLSAHWPSHKTASVRVLEQAYKLYYVCGYRVRAVLLNYCPCSNV